MQFVYFLHLEDPVLVQKQNNIIQLRGFVILSISTVLEVNRVFQQPMVDGNCHEFSYGTKINEF